MSYPSVDEKANKNEVERLTAEAKAAKAAQEAEELRGMSSSDIQDITNLREERKETERKETEGSLQRTESDFLENADNLEKATRYKNNYSPNPQAEAEAIVLANLLHSVVRTTLTAGKSPNSDRGIEEQLRLRWAKGDTVKLFIDEYRCPISAEVTAQAIWELALAIF